MAQPHGQPPAAQHPALAIRPSPSGNVGTDAFDEFLHVLKHNKTNFPAINRAYQRFLHVGVPALVANMPPEAAEAFQYRMACQVITFQELWKQFDKENPGRGCTGVRGHAIGDDCYD